MILIESVKDMFSNRLAVVSIKDNFINLDFDEPYGKFKAGDGLSREYFSSSELTHFKNLFKIKKLPFEIYSSYILDDVYYYMRKG